ncbi:MAG: fimbrillin family protein, partial [Bacteroidales bacterium]|nr:fimbrillin family protein [Bacteroidales bacterium]
MNRTKILFAIAAALLLAGCGKELAPMGAEMTVEATLGALTKVSADGSAFTTGDQIAVYAWLGSATKNPSTRVVDGVVNTFDGSKWTPATMMRWQVTDDPHYFLGVYPAPKAAIADLTAVPYALDPADYAAGDLLLATTPAGVKNTGAAVPLGFHHVMARLDVNLRFRNEWPSAPAASSVSVCVEAKSGATVNYLTQTVTPSGAAGNIALVPATAATGYSLGYSSLQVPQDGVKKIIVEVDGFEYVFASANDIPLTGGKYTTLNLVLGKDKLELASVSVSDWTATMLSGVEADPTWALATPLTIEAKEAGAGVRFDIYTEEATNPVYFRTHDGVAWSDWAEYSSGTTVTLAKVGDKVQFKGNNARYARGGNDASTFAFSKDCYVYGNIMSLITSTDFSICTTFTKDYALQNLFYGNAHIQWHPTQELLLPATKLSEYCYKEMFSQSSVTSSPKLPAKTLMTGCYDAMFWHSALKVAPELPATTLRSSCYREMFYGCADLTTAPSVLPATTLEDSCYEDMFYGCTSLETAPAISAITMADHSCGSMFSGCTSLKNVPDLPATTMARRCCEYMFSGCTSLETAPAISAITMADYSCDSMFYGCTSLKNVLDLPATTMAQYCCKKMFYGCTSLTTA